MARTPEELLSRMSQTDMADVEAIERTIDADLEARYKGGEYEYDARTKLPATVITELQRRYTGWIVQSTYSGYRLHLTPIRLTFGDRTRDTSPSGRRASPMTA